MKSRLHKLVYPSEIRAEGDGGSFSGYGSVFGTRDSYSEVVAPGAFKASLTAHKENNTLPAMLWQHDPGRPIGTYSEMREDSRGLFVKGDLLMNTKDGAEAHAFLKAGALSGLSIGFMPGESDYDSKTGIRTLTQVDLWEVSVVTFPSNTDARVSAVKADDLESIADIEKTLREAGFSKSESRDLISRIHTLDRSGCEARRQNFDLMANAKRLLARIN